MRLLKKDETQQESLCLQLCVCFVFCKGMWLKVGSVHHPLPQPVRCAVTTLLGDILKMKL